MGSLWTGNCGSTAKLVDGVGGGGHWTINYSAPPDMDNSMVSERWASFQALVCLNVIILYVSDGRKGGRLTQNIIALFHIDKM